MGLSVVKSLAGMREAQRSSAAAQGSQPAHGGPPSPASANVERKDMGFESKTNISPGIYGLCGPGHGLNRPGLSFLLGKAGAAARPQQAAAHRQ